MKTLFLYSIFHANLSFSSVPKDKYPNIVDNCYWPLLDLVKSGHKMGIEFPSSTLQTIQETDASFIRELAQLWKEGACEIIGSGFNQNVFPLIPYEANIMNLKQGMIDYEEILGRRPTLAFVNEQTYSGGLPSVYLDAGFKAIVMDWDNASEYHKYPPELRYRPVLVEGVDGSVIPVIWNSSLNSYKFQRCIYNRMRVEQFVSEIMSHFPYDEDRALVLYGTDLELFNYRPITQEETTGEIQKIGHIFSLLKRKEGIIFLNPSEVFHYFATFDKVKIESPESPLPCKNRDDYNVIRWAVSGRDDVWINTECHKIYTHIKNLSCLNDESDLDAKWKQLNVLWGSDLRTKTTNEKHYEGRKKLGQMLSELDGEFDFYSNRIDIDKDFVLFNPHSTEWQAEPYELEFYFEEGRFFKKVSVKIGGVSIPTQCEALTRYRDGSVRTIRLICLPTLGPYELVQGELFEEGEQKSDEVIRFLDGGTQIETKEVTLHLSAATGGDVRSLTFPNIFGSPLIGYLSPVYFDHVGHSHDYYSLGVHVLDANKGVINDTKLTQLKVDGVPGRFPVRVPIVCKIDLGIGVLWKRYFVYQNIPRVDLDYAFYLENLAPDSFRLAIATVNPQSFSKDYLRFSTVNGSPHVEHFYVRGKKFHHNDPVGSFSSGRCCLGATEGWVDISDQSKGLSIISDKSLMYSAPMVEYEEIKKSYLLRLYHSISESDETGKIYWRGHNKASFSFIGHKNTLSKIRTYAEHINRKLIFVPKVKRGERCTSEAPVEKKAFCE